MTRRFRELGERGCVPVVLRLGGGRGAVEAGLPLMPRVKVCGRVAIGK
jgi:hypothetical protein